jgi:NAD-dependent dihydropyrimidine dehydrogenase PreA subunit
VVFSPTGGCLKIANSIKGFLEERPGNDQVGIHNITKPEIRRTFRAIPQNIDYVIIIFPIYADTLPPIVTEYLESLSIKHLPVSLVAGFGNINSGMALFHARKIIKSKGNVVCSACTIVTPHSYNGSLLKIAVNEPSAQNLGVLSQFMLKSIDKARQANHLSLCETKLPEGQMRFICRVPYKFFMQVFIKKPVVIPDRCNQCMVCTKVCPSGAIDTTLKIDSGKCIYCLACVKYCKKIARVFETRTSMLVNTLKRDGKEIKQNKFYI